MSIELKAEKRENLGSLQAKKIKRSGRIPAVIYSNDGNINLSLNTREFEVEYFKGDSKSSVIELDLDGKKIKVIAHAIDLDPVSDRPVHVDFLICNKTGIKAQPKLNFINKDKSIGLKRGGFLHVALRTITVICDSQEVVPTSIDVDVASLQSGEKIRSADLDLPKGVKVANKKAFLIASIIGRSGKADEETPEAAASTEAAPAAAEAEKK